MEQLGDWLCERPAVQRWVDVGTFPQHLSMAALYLVPVTIACWTLSLPRYRQFSTSTRSVVDRDPMYATSDIALGLRTPDYEFEGCVLAYVLVGRDKGASSDSDLPRGSFTAIRPVVNFKASRMT